MRELRTCQFFYEFGGVGGCREIIVFAGIGSEVGIQGLIMCEYVKDSLSDV